MRWSLDFTAILARDARIARRRLDLEQAFLDLRHFELEQLDRGTPGTMRDRISCGPRLLRSIFSRKARTRSPTRRFSFGIIWSRGSTASMRPDSMMALPRSMRLIVPVTRCSLRARKSLQDLLALGIADLLQDDLLGGLRADAPELHRLERLLDVVVELRCRASALRLARARSARSGASTTSSGTTCQRRKER